MHKDREVPDTTHMIADFPSGHTVGNRRLYGERAGAGRYDPGAQGDDVPGREWYRDPPERAFADEIEGSKEQIGTGEDIGAHERDFIAAIRTGKKPNCDIELATRVQVTISMAEMSYRQNKMMRFDADKMQLIKS